MTDRRRDVLNTLRSADVPLSILGIARHLDLHPNTVRFHLQVLVASGQVERVEPTRTVPGRPALLFRAHRGMDPAGPRNYQLLANVLATSLNADAETTDKAVAAGRAWGSRSAGAEGDKPHTDDEATDRLVEILDEMGFAPRRRSSAEDLEIELMHCPFLDLVAEDAQVICPVHLGLMQGVLTALEAEVTVDTLEPFAEPDLCLARLASTGPR